VWFHGSPLELDSLAAGSTITRDRDVARVFSHRPTLVSRDDDLRIQHNGDAQGILYEVEGVSDDDVYPHPRTTMDPGVEWLTNRDLPLRRLEATVLRAEELLTESDIQELFRRRPR
jgi:hypothetical protein